ncbi:MAG: ribosome maturation factor RimM [Desulfoprunum sp.]|nr:ribosome maturation factor RimM [Desulfoprunum sp.]
MTSTFSYSPKTHVLIGEVVKAQGLHGELKIFCYSGQPENLKDYHCLVLARKNGGVSVEYTIERSRKQGGSAIVLLQTIADRNTAEQCVGCGVLVARRDLPAPQAGEFYWLDIQGKKVRTTDDRELGEVTYLFSNGAQDVMVISDGQNEYMVPVVAGIVLSVTEEAILIEPPTGLLEMNISRDD